MESNGSQDSRRGASRRPGKKPAEFMFIESTAGVNAKPDKEVRSFVMKTARRQKTWSTRQKSPKTEDGASPPDEEQSASKTRSRIEEASPVNTTSLFGFTRSPDAFLAQSRGSPVSTRNGSVFSSHSRNRPYITLQSSCGSVCDIPNCTGELCNQPHEAHSALVVRDGFSVGFAADFDCLAIPMDAKMKSLLDNFINVYSTLLIPLDPHQSSRTPTSKWVSDGVTSTTGAPFIYALATCSALIPQTAGCTGPREVFTYKALTIEKINNLLLDPINKVDDNNIAAVFMLLCLEESQLAHREQQKDGDWTEGHRQLHLNGLTAMIGQRGGLAALGSNQCLQTFILMHSIAHAITTFERPYTTLVDATGQIQQYDIPSFRRKPTSIHTLRLFKPLKLDPALLAILSNIVVFIGDLTFWFEDRKSPMDPLELQKHICLLTYRLLHWYKRGDEGPSIGASRNPVDQGVCLASLIFLVIAYEQHYHLMVQTAAQKLKAALEQCLFRWEKANDLLMWTLTMGALATQGTERFAFFKQYCGIAFRNQGFNEFTNAEEMLDRMRKCLWLPKLDEEVKKLWTHIGFCKGEEVVETVEEGYMSPEGIKKEDIVGGLTSGRFFGKRSESR